MTYEVTIIFKEGKYEDHGYIVSGITDIGVSNGIYTISYLEEGFEDKKRVVTYDINDVFSVIIEEA